MKLIRALTLWAAILAIPAGARADETAPAAEPPAEEKEWSASVGFDVWSEYIFRGVDLSGNDVMFNPYASFSWKGFTAYYWGAFNDADPGRWYEETDLGIEYGMDVLDGKLTLAGGALWYLYLDGVSGRDTVELYGKATVNVLLSPYVSLYYDIDEFHGGYLSFGVSHSFDLTETLGLGEGMALSIDPSAQLSFDLGYNSRNTQSNFDLNDLLLGVKVPFQITEMISVHAGVQLSIALSALSDGYGQGNELIGNAGVTLSF
jgi:hypothetical protein